MDTKVISIFAVALMLVITGVSCSDDPDSQPELPDTQPELPPVDALQIDFSQFIDNPSPQKSMNLVGSYENALYSYTTVAIWSALVTVPMIVPVHAYLECAKQTPVYLGDSSWQWSCTWAGTETYSARLVTKRISNEEFSAGMYITRSGYFENFKWFEGTVRYDRTHAEWTMYGIPPDDTEWLEIVWNMDWVNEVSDITYTCIKPGEENTGSYITCGIVDDAIYDAFFTISLSQGETYIEWNRNEKTGRVKDANHFGNTDWHCWDALLQDVDCN